MTSAKEACEQLLQDALNAGGTDNITIIVGRPVVARELVDPDTMPAESAVTEERAQSAA